MKRFAITTINKTRSQKKYSSSYQMNINLPCLTHIILIDVAFPRSLLLTDNTEFDAQVPAEVPFGAGQWHPKTTIFNVQDVCVQGDRIYCGDRLSKWKGRTLMQLMQRTGLDRPNPIGQIAIWIVINIVASHFQITQLKIDNNPFAKGFRDSGAGKREKKWVYTQYPCSYNILMGFRDY